MAASKNERPDLIFERRREVEGFTSVGVQEYSNLKPIPVVRELIQNSLDAVRGTGRTKAIVHFELKEMLRDDVPAIKKYTSAFKGAVEQAKPKNGDLRGPVKSIVKSIRTCLDKERIEVLSILDNGSLDKRGMASLLGNGVSDKPEGSTGTAGNGHFTVIPTSDLRYVLYGGVSDGKRIASGHAILATFKHDSKKMGKDGYYTLPHRPDDDQFHFPSGDAIEQLIKEKLDWIETQFDSKSGAAVIVPGFNRFRKRTDLWDVIQKAAACNFFVAIDDGHLEITYEDHIKGKKGYLNKSNIKKLFEGELGSKIRAETKGFLSGKRAAEAYKTATEGEKYRVPVGCGSVDVILRKTEDSDFHIDLCRNGMWITDDFSSDLSSDEFKGYFKPFHCLIKVTSEDGEIHNLISNSEGPLHGSTDEMRDSDEWPRLNNAFKLISKFLEDNTERLERDEFFADDGLNVPGTTFEDVPLRGPRTLPRDNITPKKPPPKNHTPPTPSVIDVTDNNTVNSFIREGILFKADWIYRGPRSWSAELHPDPSEKQDEDVNAEIRFVLDEYIDYTSTGRSDEQFVKLKAVKINEKTALDSDLVKNKESGIVEGVRLVQFNKGAKLSFNYDLPDGVETQEINDEVLRAYIVVRQDQS